MKRNIQLCISCLFLVNTFYAQSTVDKDNLHIVKHHVIVLIDQSGSINPADAQYLYHREIENLLFQKGRVLSKRKLLDGDQGDLLSVYTFNIRANQSLAQDLITKVRVCIKDGLEQAKAISDVESEVFNPALFKDAATALTFAESKVLVDLQKTQTEKVNRTFFVIISDLIPNDDDEKGTGDEYSTLTKKGFGVNITSKDIKDKDMFLDNYVREWKKFESTENAVERENKKSYRGILLKIREVIPNPRSLVLDELIDLPKPIRFQKSAGGYRYFLPQINASSAFSIHQMSYSWQGAGKEVVIEESVLDSAIISLPLQAPPTELKLKFWVAFQDSLYGKMILHPDDTEDKRNRQLSITRSIETVEKPPMFKLWHQIALTGLFLLVLFGLMVQTKINRFDLKEL